MKILLDECLPKRLAKYLPSHDVQTGPQAGWAGLKNGRLLGVAQESFDFFLTVDQNLVSQQNIPKFSIGIIVIESFSNDLETLIPMMPAVLEILSSGVLSGVHRVKI